MKLVTMLAGDRAKIQIVVDLLQIVSNNLDAIVCESVEKKMLDECVRDIDRVKSKLHNIDIDALTYQLDPGKRLPE